MKKTLCILLAAIFIASALASCAVSPSVNAHIRVTSSDAVDAAAWLSDRLGERLTDRVVIGTDAADYGVSVETLEADGFFIRSFGREDVLLAKTPDGLDRAVRMYAKAVEAGEPIVDVTYHEGARIERFMIAGNDISEYTIKVEGGNKYWHKRVVDDAAANLAEIIGIACGVTPELDGSAPRTILFRQIENDKYSEGTFRYFVSGGDLIIEYAELLGAKYAIQRIAEEELGWIDFTAGFDYLPEAEHKDIPADRDVTVEPMFDAYLPGSLSGINSHPSTSIWACTNKAGWAGHGLSDYRFKDIFPPDDSKQPCLTNEDLRETVVEILLEDFIDPVIKAGGHIGDELTSINLGQRDGMDSFCKCAACLRVLKEEGAFSGLVIRWVNAIDDDVDAAGHDGIIYNVFAYVETKYPPKQARPHDDVYVMMCTDFACDKHLLDGSQCQWKTYCAGRYWYDNAEMCEYIAGWTAMTDNLFIYHYALNCGFMPHCMLDTLYEDNVQFKKLGVRRMMWEVANYDYHYQWTPGKGHPKLGFYMIMQAMCAWQNLHPDATKDEYRDHYRVTLERLYGEGWSDVARFIDLWDEAELAVKDCSHCWNSSEFDNHLDHETFFESWDEMIDLLEHAASLADDAAMEERLMTLLAQAYFTGCKLGYDDAVAAGDEARIALLSERYDLFVAAIKGMGYGLRYNYLNDHWIVYGETIEEMGPISEPTH